MSRGKIRILIGLVCLIITSSVMADIPNSINYQGRLTNDANIPVDDGSYNMVFKIYGSSSGSDVIWNSGTVSILVINGIFNVQLGISPMPPLPNDMFSESTSRYLGITIESDPEMFPRTRITSGAYSFHALHSDTAEYAQNVIGGAGGWNDDGSEIYLSNINDSVGIGTSNPQAKVHIFTPSTEVKLGQSTIAVRGEHPMSSSYGYLGSLNIGAYGYSDDNYGVQGVTYNGKGVYGSTSNNMGIGVYGENINGNYAYLGAKSYGIYSHSTNDYAGYFEGKVQMSNNLFVDGNIGIGTTSPKSKLDVAGLARVRGDTWPASGEGMELAYSSIYNKGYIQVYDRDSDVWGNLFLGNGNVGIGTTDPLASLHVNAGNIHSSGTTRNLTWKTGENFQMGH